jgi:hypothetical protein
MLFWSRFFNFMFPPAEDQSADFRTPTSIAQGNPVGSLNAAQKVAIFFLRLGGMILAIYSLVSVLTWAIYGDFSRSPAAAVRGVEGNLYWSVIGFALMALGLRLGKWIGRDLG